MSIEFFRPPTVMRSGAICFACEDGHAELRRELPEAAEVGIKCRGPSTPQFHSQATETAALRMTLAVGQSRANLSATAAQSPAAEFRSSLRQSCTVSRRDKTFLQDNP